MKRGSGVGENKAVIQRKKKRRYFLIVSRRLRSTAQINEPKPPAHRCGKGAAMPGCVCVCVCVCGCSTCALWLSTTVCVTLNVGVGSELYRVRRWHLWMTCDRRRGSRVIRGQRKWAHRKCWHTGPPFACAASRAAAPPEDWGLSAPAKPHPGLHHDSEIPTKNHTKNRVSTA